MRNNREPWEKHLPLEQMKPRYDPGVSRLLVREALSHAVGNSSKDRLSTVTWKEICSEGRKQTDFKEAQINYLSLLQFPER